MTVAELIGKLRTKKQTASRTAFTQYMSLVRDLAHGTEVDSDEVATVLDATGRTETDLEHDVSLQQERNGRYAQLKANRQASVDRIGAERDLQAAQAKLQKAHDELMPAINAAASRLQMLDQMVITTSYAEAWLAENVLDQDLLAREKSVASQLAEVNAELKPLLEDREHKASSLMNAELYLQQITGRTDDAWPTLGTINPLFWRNKDTIPAQERVNDLKSQLAQLDEAIRPRQAEQRRLQSELNEIHRLKLEP